MWLETIRVRIWESDVELKGAEFWEALRPAQLPPDLDGYDVYTNTAHQNEAMLVLRWSAPQADGMGSDLARSMAQRLKAHGMVSRSAWANKTA